MTHEEWITEAKSLFGPDPKDWRFRCPNCGHVQTIADFIEAGIEEPGSKVHFSCIGRWTNGPGELGNPESPCNYTLGGLFKLDHLDVEIDGDVVMSFPFDMPAKVTEAVNP